MAKGVEVRGGKIRVYFSYQGKLCREPIGLPATEENLAYAERLVQMVRHEIKIGTFDYAKHFPNSRNLAENTVGHYARLWLEMKEGKVAKSTLYGYRTCVDRILAGLDTRQADRVDYIELERWISHDLGHLASKTIKETVAVLSQIYSLYQTRNRSSWNPTTGLKIRLPDSEDPDPFTREELRRIAATPTTRVQDMNLFDFMVWSGPRVSEAIALAWEDIDMERGLVRYRRAAVRKGYKTTKTRRSSRQVELIKPAMDALRRQAQITQAFEPIEVEVLERDNRTARVEKIRPVFRPLQVGSGMPYTTDFGIREYFLFPHLERAGVRRRGPGNCRHTFISQCLTAGLPVKWIADQVGHSTPEMIYKRYGAWISSDAEDIRTLAEKRLGFT